MNVNSFFIYAQSILRLEWEYSRTTTNPLTILVVVQLHLEWENHSEWVLSQWREFTRQPLTEFWWHILSGCQVCDWGIYSTTCAIHRDNFGGRWLSGCHSSVAKPWRLKPEVSWVRLPARCPEHIYNSRQDTLSIYITPSTYIYNS